MNTKPQNHIVVIGAGFAGLQLVKKLKHPNAKITIIDKRNHHLFQPLLYQVATTILPTSEIAWPIRSVLRRRKNVTTLMAEVSGIDTANKRITFTHGDQLCYDTLVIATGATHSYFGNDEWENDAPGLKTLEDAVTIRRRILRAFEYAERESDPEKRKAWLTFSIIGAGPTGVELAGIVAELAQKVLPREFRNINTRDARVLLIEAGPRILSSFPEKLSAHAHQSLEKMGVTLMMGHPVTNCTKDIICVDGENIGCHTAIWAAGVSASPAAKWLNVEADRVGRVIVEPDLSVKNLNDVFVIGDTACVQMPDGKAVPGLAPAAKQQGEYVARLLKNRLDHKPTSKIFRYAHQGNLATVGKRSAIADFGFITLKGNLAWWIWGIVHIYFLIGSRSRIAVALSWLWSYLSGVNSSRLITQRDQRNFQSVDQEH